MNELATTPDSLADGALRAVVIDSLAIQPGATLTQIKTRLHALADWIRESAPRAQTRACVDTAPMMEKELARNMQPEQILVVQAR